MDGDLELLRGVRQLLRLTPDCSLQSQSAKRFLCGRDHGVLPLCPTISIVLHAVNPLGMRKWRPQYAMLKVGQ